MNIEKFKQFVKEQRAMKMLTPFDLVYNSLEELGYTDKNEEFYLNNASYIVEELRTLNWDKYLKEEKKFSSYIYEQLINKELLANMDKVEAIKWYLNKYTEHIYALSLSNTQSRRSRAGNEFESIIELILMGSKIPFDTQGSVGAGLFESTHMAKLVDCVSPGASEYKLDKRNTSLISAKTTLRERWQEVGDEMSRTKAREMYLATLDEKISDNVIKLIGRNNIILVTTKGNKDTLYTNSPYVMSFEDMLEELKTKSMTWSNYVYPKVEFEEKKRRYLEQIEKFKEKPFLANYYNFQLESLNNQHDKA